MPHSHRTALVTGASRGIGSAIAERLAREGFTVIVNYKGNQAKAQEVVAAIEAQGGHAVAIQADIASAEEVARLFSETLAINGKLDVAVHNAGAMSTSPIMPDSLAEMDRMLQINLRGAFLVLAQAAQHVAPGGSIIALSSSVIAKSFPGYGPYIASKAGVEGLVRVLANEMRGKEVTVNAVAPGPVGTELFYEGKSDELVDNLAKQSPLERIGTPEDIANVVAMLAGSNGRWVNAQVVRANGGFA